MWPHDVSTLGKLLRIVVLTLQNAEYHRSCDVWSAHQAMQDSYLNHSRELVEITRSVIITTGSSFQSQCVRDSVLPELDNLCKGLALLIQYPELLSHYHMVCCCEIEARPTHFGCSFKHRGICWILEFKLYFCVLIIAHFSTHVEYIQMIPKKLCEPPLQMTNLACQRTK